MAVFEYLCQLTSVEVLSEDDEPADTSELCVAFLPRMVEVLTSDRLHQHLRFDVEQSWVGYPPPPRDFSACDIVCIMLCSSTYTFNRTSFPWEGATELTFQRLWRLAERICKMSVESTVMTVLLQGRTMYGYSMSRSLPGMAPAHEDATLEECEPDFMRRMRTDVDAHAYSQPQRSTTPIYVVSQLSVFEVVTLASLYSR